MDWFRTGAEKWNHAPSQYKLGVYHAHGLGGLDSINLVAAQRYLKLAATTHDEAQKKLGEVTFMHAWDLWHNQKQYQRGLKQFEQADVPEALVALGHIYHTGFSGDPQCLILQSYKQAFTYYSAAARHMNAEAALMLGSYYEEGYLHGMENLDEALSWYEKAYRWNGGALAELAIGKLKHHLALLDKDAALDLQEEAYTWFEGAAASSSGLDYGHAKVMIALYHLKGWGRKTCDPSRGFAMLLAIDTAEAMGEVALCYEQGLGVAQDYEKALYYWEAVVEAASDDVLALRKLAELYRSGLAGPCDPEKANEYGARADAIGKWTLS
jgi:TPR repeat protein